MTERPSYSVKSIEKESNNISIPFSPVKDFNWIEAIFISNNIYSILRKFYNKTSETLHQKNWINNTSKILEEEIFEWKNIVEAISEELKKELKNKNLELKDISEIWIQNWILVINLKNEEKIYFNLEAKNLTELVVKQELQKTKEEVESHISSYVIWWTIFTLTFAPIIWYESNRILKIILNQKWKKISLDVNETINWKITDSEILKLVKKNWIIYNSERWEFVFKNPIDRLKVSLLNKSLENLKYETWKLELEKAWIEKIPTEEEFNKFKSEWNKFINQKFEEFNSKKIKWSFWKFFEKEFFKSMKESINLKTIWEKSMHYALLPIFLQEIHKNTGSTQSYIEAWWEIVGFYSWVAITWGLSSILWIKHPLFMLVWSVVLWTLWTLATKHEIEKYDKKLLSIDPNKDIEDWTKSVDMQIISAWTIYDFLDTIDFDFTESYIDMSNNINASTNPEFYLAKRFWWVKHWNKELDQYKEKTVNRIDKLLYKDYRYSDILENKEDLKNNFLETLLWNKQWSVRIFEEKKYWKIIENVVNFIEKNLPKNLYCWDEENYKIFEEKFKIYLNTIFKDQNKIELILTSFKKQSEKDFLENIETITWKKRDLIQTHIWNSGKESEFMNDIQKDSLKRFSDLLYYEYSRYKKEITPDYKVDEINHKFDKKAEKRWKNKANFIKNESLNIIENNRINNDYIKKYELNVENKKWLLELAFEWKLTTKVEWEEWKYITLTNWVESSVPIKKANWEVRQIVIHENIDDILYVNSLSEKDRNFIKKRIYNSIINWKDISKWSVWIHLVEPKFKKLIQNPQFYNFYKRMLILAKQNFYIKNIRKYWDAVKFDEENSYILHPINNFKKLVNKIIDN